MDGGAHTAQPAGGMACANPGCLRRSYYERRLRRNHANCLMAPVNPNASVDKTRQPGLAGVIIVNSMFIADDPAPSNLVH